MRRKAFICEGLEPPRTILQGYINWKTKDRATCTAFRVWKTKHACIKHHHRDYKRLIDIIFDMFAHLHVIGMITRCWQDTDILLARQLRQRFTTPITILSGFTSTSPVPAVVSLDLENGLRLIVVLTESEQRNSLSVALHFT
jgi:hypothetical protein